MKEFDENIKFNEDEMITIEHYEKMFEDGISCCDCGQPLTHDEVISFHTVGISTEEDMECPECFWRNVWEDMRGL